jgi:F-type H+-transporting ATPase subunit gamma
MKALAASSIGAYQNSVIALADYNRAVELGLGANFRAKESMAAAANKRQESDGTAMRAVVFGSDQGLVGQFNDSAVEYAVKTLAPLAAKPRIWAVGERVRDRLADAGLAAEALFNVPNSVTAIAPLVALILSATDTQDANLHPLYLFYNRPVTGGAYAPTGQRLLPLDDIWRRNLAEIPWPSPSLPEVIGHGAAALRALIHEYLFISMFKACAESLASENASRLAAMERADRNIQQLLEELQGKFHRLRQSDIDDELFDVISGFEALILQAVPLPKR